MKGFWSLAVPALIMAYWPCAGAQYRTDAAEVVPQRMPARPLSAPDTAAEFADRYAGAGKPRIMIYWGVRLSEQTESARYAKEVSRSREVDGTVSSLKESVGPDGRDVLRESDRDLRLTTSVTRTSGILPETRAGSMLSSRDDAMLRDGFQGALARAGVRLIDRTLVIRSTAATGYRSGAADPRLVEADALQKHVDLLLEMQMVPDDAAPLGIGFRVHALDIATGRSMMVLYSRALPPTRRISDEAWVATDRGFERRSAQYAQNTVEDVGRALAAEVMQRLSPVLPRSGARGRRD